VELPERSAPIYVRYGAGRYVEPCAFRKDSTHCGPVSNLDPENHAGQTTGNRGWSITAPAGSSASRPSKGGEVVHGRGACRASADR
jgi:hypothetical protein